MALKARRLFALSLAVLVAGLALSPVAFPAASAGDGGNGLSWLAPYAIIMVVVGAVGIVVCVVQRDSMKPKNLTVLLAASLILLVVGILPLVTPGTVTPPGDEDFTFDVAWSADTTDASNTIPAGNYDSIDTEAGGTTSQWGATEARYDSSAKSMEALVAIDNQIPYSGALWMEPNAVLVDVAVRLTNGHDSDGDGTTDSVNYYLRIASISRVTLSNDGSNGTVNTVGFVRDGIDETGDWYILYLTDGSTWIPACPEARASAIPPSSCGWQQVGSHNGGAADTVSWLFILEDYGLFGYQEPAVGAKVLISLEFGGPGVVSQTLSFIITLNYRGTTDNS